MQRDRNILTVKRRFELQSDDTDRCVENRVNLQKKSPPAIHPETTAVTLFKTCRTFAATPEAVFDAFAAPQRLARWWGPDGFQNTFEIFEFKPGGRWYFTMHGPDGTDYPNESVFIAIEAARSVVLRHICQPHFQLSIQLEQTASGTLVTWEQEFESAEFAASVRHIIEPANEQNLNRWQTEVSTDGRAAT